PPQDRAYRGEPTGVVIGDRNIIREYATIHRASGEGNRTIVGSDNFFMAVAHVAHNCRIGNHVTLVNFTGLAGHVQIDDHAFLGGGCIVHQFTRIGRLAICGAHCKVVQDIPPFALVDGVPARVHGINRIGLQRVGVGPESRRAIKEAYRFLYLSGLNTTQAVARIEEELGGDPEVRHLLAFLTEEQVRQRGLTQWERT
ncbi:MAG: acyl-ACP--UDP-N-acetylglucosamine O-acyltransferase, partial [Armatimonadetes bacterium]|nr:acyl-ACP--UDP-N-acetylglucosamine O-acyltransferase [Armatimonadota bacterium]